MSKYLRGKWSGFLLAVSAVAIGCGGERIEGSEPRPEDTAQSDQTLEIEAGVLRLPKGVEVLASVSLENGNTAQFISDGTAWTVIESGPVGNNRLYPAVQAKASTPVEQFKLLVPGKPVPERLAQAEQGLTANRPVSAPAADAKSKEAEEFDKLKQQQTGQPAAPVDGLNQTSQCGQSWFRNNICVGFQTFFGTAPDTSWFHGNRTATDIVNRNGAWSGDHIVCGDIGTVTFELVTPSHSIGFDVNAGWWAGSGRWEEWQRTELCSGWSCETITHPRFVNATSRVFNITGSDRFHYCGWYDIDGN
jgi:hypothetical protein